MLTLVVRQQGSVRPAPQTGLSGSPPSPHTTLLLAVSSKHWITLSLFKPHLLSVAGPQDAEFLQAGGDD